MTSEAEHLAPMRAWLRDRLRGHGLDAAAEAGLVVAVGELCANAIKHGYGGRSGQPVVVRITPGADRFVIDVEDFGVPFEPDAYVVPDLDALPEHGLGLFIVRQSADEVTFEPSRARGTRCTLVKYLAGAGTEATAAGEEGAMDIEVTQSSGIEVVALSGDLDTASVGPVRRTLSELVDRGHTRVVVDLAGVPYIDSSGLGALVALMKHARAAGGDLRFAGLQPDVRSVFEMTRLTKIVSVHATRDEAAASWR